MERNCYSRLIDIVGDVTEWKSDSILRFRAPKCNLQKRGGEHETVSSGVKSR